MRAFCVDLGTRREIFTLPIPTCWSPDAKVTRRQIVGGSDASHLPIFYGIFLRIGAKTGVFFSRWGLRALGDAKIARRKQFCVLLEYRLYNS